MKIIKPLEYVEVEKFIEIDGEQVDASYTYRDHAIGECNWCKAEVVLAHFTNTCECGADYNSGGQELAPRECWGEETNESLSDILRIP
jgi:hypothetical protein